MPTLDSVRGRMIAIHSIRPGMSIYAVYNQVKQELGYTLPLRYIEDKIQVMYGGGGLIQWKERRKE